MRGALGTIFATGCLIAACQELPTEPTPIDLSEEQPIAVPDTATTDEDVDLIIDVLANDSSLVEDELQLTEIEVAPTEGEATIESGQVRYEPAANFSGIDSLRYVVSGSVLSNIGSVYIVVRPVNDPPVANDDEFQISETGALGKVQAELDVLANDTDIDGDRLSVLRTTAPSNGEVEIPEGGQWVVYTPNPDYVGLDSFRYTIQDGNGGLDVANVQVTVIASNDPPIAQNDSYAAFEDQLLTVAAPGVLGNDTDDDGDPLEALLREDVANGQLELMSDGSFTYLPDADFSGPDTFSYVTSDGMGESNEAVVTITVLSVNDRPVAIADTFRVNEDAELSVTPPGVLANDLDPEGATLVAQLVSDVSNGSLVFSADGSFTYVGLQDFNGTDTFVYRASDGDFESEDATVTIYVEPVNDAPSASVDSYDLNEDEVLEVAAPGVLANDSDKDGDDLTATLLTQPSSGSVALQSDGSFSYTPNPDFSGLDGFTYSASDGLLSSAAAVTLRVQTVNDSPVANDDSYETPANVVLEVPAPGVLQNDTDPENDRLAATLVAEPLHGVALMGADGSLRYEPAIGYVGDDVLTYEVADATLTSDPATVTISVTAVGRPPIAADDFFSTSSDSVLVVEAPGLLDNDTDPDQDSLSVVVEEEVTVGVLTLMDDGSFEFEPPADYAGVAEFSYRATDGQNLSNVARVQITVQE